MDAPYRHAPPVVTEPAPVDAPLPAPVREVPFASRTVELVPVVVYVAIALCGWWRSVVV